MEPFVRVFELPKKGHIMSSPKEFEQSGHLLRREASEPELPYSCAPLVPEEWAEVSVSGSRSHVI
jgi:hypothetical protein